MSYIVSGFAGRVIVAIIPKKCLMLRLHRTEWRSALTLVRSSCGTLILAHWPGSRCALLPGMYP
jgi:hypothetical protein